MADIKLKEIDESSLDEFIRVPALLYRNDQFWVSDLDSNVRHVLGLSHPFWKRARRKLWVAYKGDVPVGRIAAITNEAHNSYHKDKVGFFGFFETENDMAVSAALLEAARGWLHAQGMDTMRGPVNPSTNESAGLLITGFDSYPKVMMPYNPPFYATHLEEAGLSKSKDLFAFIRFVETSMSERLEKIIARVESRDMIHLRHGNLADLGRELERIRVIYNDAWKDNWGFVPISEAEMEETAKALKPILKPEHIIVLEVDNVPAAFSVTIPDINLALRGVKGRLNILNIISFLFAMGKVNQGRLILLGVKTEFRNRGLELVLIKRAIENAKALGWTCAELSWILEDNNKIINVIEEAGGKLYKKYRIYEQALVHDTDAPAVKAASQL